MAKRKLYTFYVALYGAPRRHVFEVASLAVAWIPSSNLWEMTSQRSGQVDHIGRSTAALRLEVCVVSPRDTSAINGWNERAMRM